MTTLLGRRSPADAAAVAQARAAEAEAKIREHRAVAELRREIAAAERAARLEERREAEEERRRKREQRRADRAAALERTTARLASLRTVAPILMVNASTVGAQGAYAYSETPADWPDPVRVVCAVVYALAAETVALYVGWHAHDALLQKAYSTAANLRRWSYTIAAVFGIINYSHFSAGWEPTAVAVALGVFSLLSPWLWGLHTRRAQHVQLVRERLIDETGAVFDPARRRHFPIRSLRARRWSIDNNVRDPKVAWEGFKADEAKRKASGREPVRESTPEPVSLDDPGIQLAARLRQEMATATDRIGAGAARVALADRSLRRWADVSVGELWAMVDATDEPDHVRRPALPCRPVQAPRPVQRRQRAIAAPAGEPGQSERSAPAQPGEGDRLGAAYARLTERLGREPSGSELGAEVGVSKATANRWKSERRAVA